MWCYAQAWRVLCRPNMVHREHWRFRTSRFCSRVMLRSPRQALRAIGFLSNITKEKGGEIIIDLAQAIKERGMPLGVVVAGPCPEDDLLQKLQHAVSEGALEWRGSTYGADKAKFWTDIDLFVFPSLNEAEPLVIWEALAAGIPVLTYERGCIRDQLEDASVLIPATADFVAPALACLEKWRTSGEEYGLQVRLAQEQYERMKEQSRLQFQELLTSLRKMMA